MYEIDNVLRPYAWGSTTAIAGLLGRPESGGPEAELWIGAHPDSPSVATRPDGTAAPLNELIAEDPGHHLGEASVAAFGPRLPFLAWPEEMRVANRGFRSHAEQRIFGRPLAAEK